MLEWVVLSIRYRYRYRRRLVYSAPPITTTVTEGRDFSRQLYIRVKLCTNAHYNLIIYISSKYYTQDGGQVCVGLKPVVLGLAANGGSGLLEGVGEMASNSRL